jgi:hypothetical protein
MAGKIDVVSAESVLDFVRRIDPGASMLVLAVETPVATTARHAYGTPREPGRYEQARTR